MLAVLEGVVLKRGDFEFRIDRLEIPDGITVIIGPNGSGKSTLLRLLVGRLKPQKGVIKRYFKKAGYSPQRDYVKRSVQIRVIDALRLVTDDEEAIRNALERVKLVHKAYTLVNSLSGGEKQRLLIARSLAVEPDAFFRDEPFAGCDFESKSLILDVIHSESRPFVIITHDPNALIDVTKTLIIMKDGRPVYVGDPRKLTRDALCFVYGPSCKILREDGKIFLRLRDQHR